MCNRRNKNELKIIKIECKECECRGIEDKSDLSETTDDADEGTNGRDDQALSHCSCTCMNDKISWNEFAKEYIHNNYKTNEDKRDLARTNERTKRTNERDEQNKQNERTNENTNEQANKRTDENKTNENIGTPNEQKSEQTNPEKMNELTDEPTDFENFQEKSYVLTSDDHVSGEKGMEIDPRFLAQIFLPPAGAAVLKIWLKNQKDSQLINSCKNWIINNENKPNKHEALKLDSEQLSVIRHLSLFKINNQGLIYRIFVKSNGEAEALIWMEDEGLTSIILEIHLKYGHINKEVIFKLITEKFYAIGIRRKIKNILIMCKSCVQYNTKQTVNFKPSSMIAEQPRDIISIDAMGPLPQSHGYRYILSLRDQCSRESFLLPLKDVSSMEMAKVLTQFFITNGSWRIAVVDGGCISLHRVDKSILQKLGVGLRQSSHTSRHQAYSERQNQTCLRRILKLLDDEPNLSGWSKLLNQISFEINMTPTDSLAGLSPFQVTRRHPMRCLAPSLDPLPGNNAVVYDFNKLLKTYKEIRLSAYNNLVSYRDHKGVEPNLTEGMVVFRKRQAFATNMNKKLQSRVVTVYEVISRIGSSMFRLKDLLNNAIVVLPADQIVRSGGLTREQGIQLIKEINA